MCEADGKIILFFYLTFYIQNTCWFIKLLGRRKQSFVIKNVKLFGSQGFVLCYVSHLISMTKVNVTMLKGAIFIWKLFDSDNKGIQRCIRPACLINNFTANPDKGKIQLIVYLYVVKHHNIYCWWNSEASQVLEYWTARHNGLICNNISLWFCGLLAKVQIFVWDWSKCNKHS